MLSQNRLKYDRPFRMGWLQLGLLALVLACEGGTDLSGGADTRDLGNQSNLQVFGTDPLSAPKRNPEFVDGETVSTHSRAVVVQGLTAYVSDELLARTQVRAFLQVSGHTPSESRSPLNRTTGSLPDMADYTVQFNRTGLQGEAKITLQLIDKNSNQIYATRGLKITLEPIITADPIID